MTGLLVVGLALLGVTTYYFIGSHLVEPTTPCAP